MSLAAGLAIGGALLDVFSGQQQANAMAKERAATAPQRRMLKQIFAEEAQNVKDLPGVLRRAREGRMSTAQAERQKRLDRALAASGATGASSVGQMAETQNMQDMERMNEEALLAEKQAVSSANRSLFGMGSNLTQIQSQVPRSYYNPMSALRAGMSGYALGNALGGAPMNPVGADMGTQSDLYNAMDAQGTSGYTWINPRYAYGKF